MIIFTKICKSVDYKDFILQNVHPANFEIPSGTYHVKFHLTCEGDSWIEFDPVI